MIIYFRYSWYTTGFSRILYYEQLIVTSTAPQEEMEREMTKEQNVNESTSKNTVAREKYKDFSQNCFKVTISRIQQTALKKAACTKLPTPGEQLALFRSEGKQSQKQHLRILAGFHVESVFKKW